MKKNNYFTNLAVIQKKIQIIQKIKKQLHIILGHSPYDAYFGKGIYNNNTKSFIIKNDNNTM